LGWVRVTKNVKEVDIEVECPNDFTIAADTHLMNDLRDD
jgi:hypothetical protein